MRDQSANARNAQVLLKNCPAKNVPTMPVVVPTDLNVTKTVTIPQSKSLRLFPAITALTPMTIFQDEMGRCPAYYASLHGHVDTLAISLAALASALLL